MSKYRARRRADAQQVLDEFEDWPLRDRSVQANTARVYAHRVVASVGWQAAPVENSLSALTPTKALDWVNLEARRACRPSTLRKQLTMLRSFLRFCHRSGRIDTDFSALVPRATVWRLSSIPDPVPEGTFQSVLESLDERSPQGLRGRAVLLLLPGLGVAARGDHRTPTLGCRPRLIGPGRPRPRFMLTILAKQARRDRARRDRST